MRLRTLTAATAVALIASVAPAVAAEAASKPAFKVTLSASATKADVGQRVKVSGKVSGPKAAKKRLSVQRRVGSGGWKTVAKVTTTSKRRYAVSVKVTTAGAQQLRVVAPKSKKARQGVSPARRLVGWRWLDLTAQPGVTGRGTVTRGPVKIAGRTYPTALTLTFNSVRWYASSQQCDTFRATAGIIDGQSGENTFEAGTWKDAQLSDAGFREYRTPLVAGAAPKRVGFSLAGTQFLAFGNFNEGTTTAVVAPVAHCRVNALKTPVLPEMPVG